jgi:hypothetical protein
VFGIGMPNRQVFFERGIINQVLLVNCVWQVERHRRVMRPFAGGVYPFTAATRRRARDETNRRREPRFHGLMPIQSSAST